MLNPYTHVDYSFCFARVPMIGFLCVILGIIGTCLLHVLLVFSLIYVSPSILPGFMLPRRNRVLLKPLGRSRQENHSATGSPTLSWDAVRFAISETHPTFRGLA